VSRPLVLLAAASELPPGEEWLRPTERATLLRLRVPKRRRDFRLGRFAAKRAMALLDGCEKAFALRRFEVRPAPGGAPLAFRDGAPLAVGLSISHSDGWASAAVHRGTRPLGCDVERIEARSAAFLEDYLTPSERAFAVSGPEIEHPLRATLVWSAKEAVMKALGEGLRLAPASVEVIPALHPVSEAGWRSFSVSAPPTAADLHGFWRAVGELVLTVAGGPAEPRLVGPLLDAAPRADPTSGRSGGEASL
jgi:4'-phosphopantetheinyl transferase